MKTLGLYIHIPFCLRKCAYCNFVSYPDRADQIDRYIDAVISEARLYNDVLRCRVIDTVFIGGGTPSLLSPTQAEKLINGLRALSVWNSPEITMEANPETLDARKLEAYAALGVSRLSIGLQTHDDDILRAIGRGHTWETFENAFLAASRYFRYINADIIFGLPGQTVKSFDDTLSHLIALSPAHISAYALKLEAGTPLAARFDGADEDTDRDMYHLAAARLHESGYSHYETSNFAKAGCECRHNLKYWTGEEYLGLGAAAYSYIIGDGHTRFGNILNFDDYLKTVEANIRPIADEETLSETDIIVEYIMLRLRLRKGIEFEDFEKRFKNSFLSRFEEAVSKTQKAGLITVDKAGIRPTLKGFDLQNALIGEYIKKL